MTTTPPDDASQQATVVAVNVMVAVLAGVAVLLRYVSRRVRRLSLKSDDITMAVALPFAWSICICNIVAAHYGLGRHVEFLTQQQITQVAQSIYASQMLWAFSIPLIKLSILLLYVRIFGSLRYFRYLAYGLGLFSIAWGLMGIFVLSFACRPVAYTWDKTIDGQCIDMTVFYIIGSGLNVVTDFLILLLPLPAVWGMQSSLQHKIQLSGIFLLGSLTCAISLARWVSLFQIQGVDQTWDLALPAIWSAVEPCLGIVAACLPTLRPLVHYLLPSLSSQSSSSLNDNNNNNASLSSPNIDNNISRINALFRNTKSTHTTDNFHPLHDLPSDSGRGSTKTLLVTSITPSSEEREQEREMESAAEVHCKV